MQESSRYNHTDELRERAIIVGVISQGQSESEVTEYLDELSFLAETAGFVDQLGEFLKPTLIGWQWLKGEYHQQLLQLWEAYLRASDDLWKRYQLLGYEQDEPSKLAERLSHHLGNLKAGAVVDIEVFAKQLARNDAVFWNLQTTWEEMKAGQNRASLRDAPEMRS